MPIQRYECEKHGFFELTFSITDPVPKVVDCFKYRPYANHDAYWRPSVCNFIVKDGTGAAKGSR